jgi:hypothetical protein
MTESRPDRGDMRKRTWPKGQRRAARVGFAQAHATALDGVRRVILVPSSRPRSPYRLPYCAVYAGEDERHTSHPALPDRTAAGEYTTGPPWQSERRTLNREWVVAYAYRLRVCRAGLLPMAMPITYTCTYIPYSLCSLNGLARQTVTRAPIHRITAPSKVACWVQIACVRAQRTLASARKDLGLARARSEIFTSTPHAGRRRRT